MSQADRYIQFISALKVPNGEQGNTPFQLQPYQRDFIEKLFGCDTRAVREALLFISKGSGKSTFTGALALAFLFLECGHALRIYSAANLRAQASITFDAAKAMVQADPLLNKLCKIVDTNRRITRLKTNSFFQALSAEADDKDGTGASLILFDELGSWKSRTLYDKLYSGMVKRKNGLVINMTTAGLAREENLGYQLYKHAKECQRDPSIDPSFLPVIYEATNDDYHDLEQWKLTNPTLGVTVFEENIKPIITKADAQPSYINEVLRAHLNRWVNADKQWMTAQAWDACAVKQCDPNTLLGRSCWVGIDLAAKIDVTALALWFPLDDGTFAVMPRFYIPTDTADEREHRDRVFYRTWLKDGHMVGTAGNVADPEYVRTDIAALAKQYRIEGIALDNWNAVQLMNGLQQDGYHNLVDMGQSMRTYSDPMKELEGLILSKRLLHNNHPVLEIRRAGLTQHRDVTRHFAMLERAASAGVVRQLPDLRPMQSLLNRAYHRRFQELLPAFDDREIQILSIDPPYVYGNDSYGSRSARSLTCDSDDAASAVGLVIDLLRDWQPKLATGGVVLLWQPWQPLFPKIGEAIATYRWAVVGPVIWHKGRPQPGNFVSPYLSGPYVWAEIAT